MEGAKTQERIEDGLNAHFPLFYAYLGVGHAKPVSELVQRLYAYMDMWHFDAYGRAKVIMGLPTLWFEAQDQERLQSSLSELIDLIDDLPVTAPDHENPRFLILQTVLTYQKKAGLRSEAEQLSRKYGNILAR